MTLIFKSKISKMNKKGVGFIYLNKDNQNKFKVDQQLKITVKLSNNKIVFFAKLRKHNRLGVYIPASFAKKYNLLFKEPTIIFEEINGFFTKTSNDGRIYFPKQEAEKLNLKQDEIVVIEGIIEGKSYIEFCQIRIRHKSQTTEYFCMFNSNLRKKEGIFNIKSVVSRNNFKIPDNIKELIKDFNYASINKDKIVMYYGIRVPILIKTNFTLDKIAHYLGCYFADGTKKGNSFGICASTFEQAKYFIKMHNLIIQDPFLKIELTYTDPFNEDKDKLKDKLCSIWLEKTGLKIPKNKIWIYRTETKDAQNRNIYGALSIREHRQLVLIYYNQLLNHFIQEIIINKNKKLALDFICGVLEGDGAPSSKSHGFVKIVTNELELKILSKIFKTLNFKHEGYSYNNRHDIRIGSIELIEHILLLKDKLFQYYPKRRKRTIERLLKTGAARFLSGKQQTTSHWILKRFREKGILTQRNELTQKGKKIKSALLELENEIKFN